MEDDESFSFPQLSKLPQQNPLLAGSKVVDKSTTADGISVPIAAAVEPPLFTENSTAPANQPPPAARPRKKVLYEKGYSQMDWIRISKSMKRRSMRKDITLEEVATHNTEEDAWTILRGRVYDLTPYLKFHPGGVKILMRVAGIDGTEMFNKYHAWVNADFLLENCIVGTLALAE